MAIPIPGAFMVSTRATQPLNADTGGDAPDQQTAKPAFITTQSLATFSGASAAVAAAWKLVAQVVDASWADQRWVPLAMCGLVGIYLILKGLETAPTAADKFGVLLVGLFNTAFVWSAVIGVDIGLDATGVADTTGGAP